MSELITDKNDSADDRVGYGRPPKQHRFKKGQSGNPGGRIGVPKEVRELARTHTEDAINRLVFWMKSDDPRASVAASNSLLDRGYGKPVAPIELDHHVGEFEGLEYHDVMRAIADEAKAMGLQIHIDESDATMT